MLTLLLYVSPISPVSAAEKSQNEKPLSQTKQEAKPDQEKQESRNSYPITKPAVPVGQPASKPTEQPGSENPPKHWHDIFWQTNMPNWLVMVGWILGLIVAWWTLGSLTEQVVANNRATNAAEESAAAAIAAAESARLALNIERPYVFVESPRLEAMDMERADGRILVSATFRIRNHGNGIAIIKHSTGKFVLAETLSPDGRMSNLRAISKPDTYKTPNPILRTGKTRRHRALHMEYDIDLWNKIVAQTYHLAVTGVVVYRDVFNRRYTTTFCFNSMPMKPQKDEGITIWKSICFAGHDRYQHHT